MEKTAGLAEKSLVTYGALFDLLMKDIDNTKFVINDVLSQRLPHAIKYLYIFL